MDQVIQAEDDAASKSPKQEGLGNNGFDSPIFKPRVEVTRVTQEPPRSSPFFRYVSTTNRSMGLPDANMDGCRVAPRQVPEPSPQRSYEPQDLNHNQEALFSLLNEALGAPCSIFWDQMVNDRVSKLAREELKKYELFGIMLWNQYRDVEIEYTVNEFYAALQSYAGNYFKLMPLFSRSQQIYRNGKKKYYWDDIYEDVEKKIAGDEFYTHVFLDALHIENKNNPYLILTDSLTSKKILLVYLKDVNLNSLIKDVGSFCSPGLDVDLNDCQKDLQSRGYYSEIIDLKDRSFAERLIGPLAEIMTNPDSGISVQVESVETHLSKAIEALENARRNLRLANEGIEAYEPESEQFLEYRTQYEALCMELLNMAALVVREPINREQLDFPKELENNLDNESRINLTSARKGLALGGYFKEDSAPIVIALGKMFENEVNLSMVQFIRKHLQIPMPEYYCKLYPAEQGHYVIDQADFNQTVGHGCWLPPECGKTQKVFYHNPNLWDEVVTGYPGAFENTTDLSRERLCNNWHELCKCRNKAAHPSEQGHTQENLECAKVAIENLKAMGCFGFMKNLRDCLECTKV